MDGGFFEDGAVTLSGGIYNIYYSDLIKNLASGSYITDNQIINIKNNMQRYYGSKMSSLIPTIDELFEILQFAIKHKNNVGTFSMQVSFRLLEIKHCKC